MSLISLKYAAFIALAAASVLGAQGPSPGPELLDFYRQLSPFTDPGPHAGLYATLPSDYVALLPIVKAQLIHPDAELPRFRSEVPRSRGDEDAKYKDVMAMLKKLAAFNEAGLVLERKPAERLILSCRSSAMLYASILKTKGVPVRLRYGYASYLLPGLNTYHVVCEVWDDASSRWIMVDPDRQLKEVPSGLFVTGGQAWLLYMDGKLDLAAWGAPGWTGAHPLTSVLVHDLASVMNEERDTREHPAFCATPPLSDQVSKGRKAILSEVARLLADVDANFEAIGAIYEKERFLRF